MRRILALVPDRSTGNPLVNHFRAIPPGERVQEANNYKDPVTLPAGDYKDNAYFKRDYRRNYPQVHGFSQTKVSGLLTLGSARNPRISIGDKGSKELAAFAPGETVSLSTTLASVDSKVLNGEVLGEHGEPIVAPSLHKFEWKILKEPQHGMFTEDYPCRIFTDAKTAARVSQ